MPEIKHVFSQGKINKDLDERLVPNGQYRDALNIQVSTSEGSDVGTVQNILGNKAFKFNVPANSVCVGAIADEKNNSLYWFVASQYIDMILEYKEGVITPVIVDTLKNVLKFNPENIITGINIIDNLLFWTDNETEPKKINIDLCKQGTNQNGFTHTNLIVPNRNITITSNVKIREEHITVIKKSPKKPLTLNITSETLIEAQSSFAFDDGTSNLYNVNDTFVISNINFTYGSNFNVGDVVFLLADGQTGTLPENFNIRLNVLENLSGKIIRTRSSFNQSNQIQQVPYPPNTYLFEVLSFDSSVTISPTSYSMLQGGNQEKFFENKLVRFACRYKYRDGEYSCFSPFSQIAFIPSKFDYQTKLAYNLGMENQIKELIISDFRQHDILENVVEIEILSKNSNSPVVYSIDKIKLTDSQTTTIVNPNGSVSPANNWESNQYKINSDIIYAALPSNQLTRPFDNVPKKALAQEVTGNRVVYANYEQNYNILNTLGKPQKPEITAWYENRFDNIDLDSELPLKSLKSNREYQVGVVYTDEYGRETPVFSSFNSIFKLPKTTSSLSTKISTSIDTNHPSWAKGLKFYIKETSNEYYNLAMDRVYQAEDGNLWLSFPSSERNKVDEETFLILKKSVDTSIAIEEEAKYKVIAINNEAPLFIKTVKKEIARTQGDTTSSPGLSVFFATNDTPQINSRSFKIKSDEWKTAIGNTSLTPLEEVNETISITFREPVQNIYSKAYVINELVDQNNFYNIILERVIDQSDSWIYPDPNNTTNTDLNSSLEIIIHKYEVTNRPEFEGKFFVKIYSDELAQDYILRPALGELTFETLAAAQTFHFSDTAFVSGTGTTNAVHSKDTTALGVPLVSYNLNNNWELVGQPFVLNSADPDLFPTTPDYLEWEDVIDAAQEDDEGVWFIDRAYFRGEAPSTPFTQSTSSSNVLAAQDTTDGYGITIDTDYVVSDVSVFMSFSWYQAIASSQERQSVPFFQQGVYTDTFTDQHYIEISFSGLDRNKLENVYDRDMPSDKVFFSIANASKINYQGLYWDGIWQVDEDQEDFASEIKAGSLFRFDGDDNEVIYQINESPQIFRRHNHTSMFDFRYAYARMLTDMTSSILRGDATAAFNRLIRSDNRRLTWKIPYKRFDGNEDDIIQSSSFSGNSILNGSVADTNTAVRITFLKDRYDEENILNTDNPAVWETEPKENIDLDIYYEASKTYPLSFDSATCGVLVSKGDVVVPSKPNVLPPKTQVVSVENQVVTLDDFANDSNLNQGDIFAFVDQDGGYIKLSFNSLINSTVDSQGNNISKQLLFYNQVINEYGLPWTNCYSFGNGVESNRLRDDFNQVIIDKGAKASAPIEDVYKQERRKSGLIYSGLYNSISGVNNLNQFIQAEKITKDLNPTYGSIQKLFSRNTDLIALCEDRIIKILANKDAVFNADGNANLTATNKVLGQAMPFAGDYGISKNPESFAKENFRAYFSDKQRGAVLRLSMDGLTPISEYGLSDYFSDNLKLNDIILGSYDGDKNNYNLTLNTSKTTVSFDEKVKGWSSFKSFIPEQAVSMANDYYTFKNAQLYKHHQEDVDRNTFYNVKYPSSISVILNEQASVIKDFKTLNYEGSQSNIVREITDVRTGYYNLNAKQGWYSPLISTDKEEGFVNEFIEKESKWFNFIKGKDVAQTLNIKTDDFSFQGVGPLKEAYSVDPDLYIEEPPPGIPGCTDIDATNYDPTATVDDGSCVYTPVVSGCMNPNATNFNPLAVVDDGSCILPVYGCTDPSAINYSDQATVNDGSCVYLQPDETIRVYGCTDPTALNYDRDANVDDGSCVWVASNYGCTDPAALNYDPNATIDVGSCVYPDPLILDPPSLSVATETPTLVEINLNFSNAQGGTGPFTYSCTYQHSAMSSPADVMDGYFTQLYPFTPYVVEIDPTPVGVQNITFVLTVVDTSNGNTVSSSNVVSAGVNPPLSGSITNTVGSFVNVISTNQLNGVPDPSGGVIYVLVLGNLELNVQASGGTQPYTAELGFNHGVNQQPVQYIDLANSDPNTSPSGPDYDDLVTVSFPQTPGYSVAVNSSTNLSNVIVLDDNFNYSAPSPQVGVIDIECLIEDANGDNITENTQADILSTNPSTFLGLYPYQ
tara:strand:- start:986 stop:7345 length:6360 start_codon:yes stop_codon:yes gene_type:complete